MIEMDENNNNNNIAEEKSNEDDKLIDKKKKSNKMVAVRKQIKKTKWKYMSIQPTIKQTNMIYIYGSVLIFTDYDPETIFNQNTLDIISRHQQTQSVTHNKISNTIETTYNIFNPGTTDFSFLVNLFERKQDQLFYNFAQSLKDFKIFVDTINKGINEKKKILKTLPKILDKLDEQYLNFQNWCDDIVEKNFKDEFYAFSIFQVNYRKGYAELKKTVCSQNMISFYGNSLEEILESEMCKLKNKQISFDRNQDFDVLQMIEALTHTLRCSAKQIRFSQIPMNLHTLEGFQIPVVSENHYLQYCDYMKNDKEFVYFNDFDYILFVNVFKVEDVWLKRLLDLRQDIQYISKPTNPQQMPQSTSTPILIDHQPIHKSGDSFRQEESDDFMILNEDSKQTQEIKSSLNQSQVDNNQDEHLESTDKMESETYFMPQVIDLIGSDCMEQVLQNSHTQHQKKEKLAKCLDNYYAYRKQAIELSTIEYSCQVEYFVDKFYNTEEVKKSDQKECLFREI